MTEIVATVFGASLVVVITSTVQELHNSDGSMDIFIPQTSIEMMPVALDPRIPVPVLIHNIPFVI